MYKYLNVANWIREKINNEEFPPGLKLPTEHALMEQFSVSRQSIRRAINELTKQGLLFSIQGSGIYVSGKSRPQSNTVALVLTNYQDYIFSAKLSGIYKELEKAGYLINLFFTDNSITKENDIFRTMAKETFAGILIDGTQSALPRIYPHLFSSIISKAPCIMMDSSYPGYNLPCVELDDIAGGYTATKFLLENGHKKIAYIGRIDYRQGQDRYIGYGQALEEFGIEIDDSLIYWYILQNYPAIYSGVTKEQLLRIFHNCSAVFCYNDRVACDLIRFLNSHGFSIPNDISIVGYDNAGLPDAPMSITSIDHPKEELGRVAAKKLVQYIQNVSLDVNYQFSPILIEGETVLKKSK